MYEPDNSKWMAGASVKPIKFYEAANCSCYKTLQNGNTTNGEDNKLKKNILLSRISRIFLSAHEQKITD